MNKKRDRFQLRLDNETTEMAKMLYPQDNCQSFNEFIEKAVKFYISYLTADEYTSFLNPMLYTAVNASIKENEHRMANNLFRLTVEMAMMMNILAQGLEVSEESLRVLRSRCIKEIKSTKGQLNIDDIIERSYDD